MSEPKKILVVDDDRPTRELMRTLLRQYDLEAVTAASGTEAVALARNVRPSLILLDLNMPDMGGGEALARLRREPALADLPVLILSGDPVDEEDLERLGAAGAIQKPFDLLDLIARIREQL